MVIESGNILALSRLIDFSRRIV